MNTKQTMWVGAVAAFLVLPPPSSAQVRGSYVRPGAQAAPAAQATPSAPVVQPAPVSPPRQFNTIQQPSPQPSFAPMRSGAILRGSRPNFGNTSNNFGNGSNYNNNPGMQRGPVIVLPNASSPSSSPVYTAPSRSGNTWSNNSNYNNSGHRFSRPNYLPPVGPANGFFNNTTPPVGPANGFGENRAAPERRHRPGWNNNRNFVYGSQPAPYPVIVNAPPLLGGYYYGGYSDNYAPNCTYPSVYSVYNGFPRYLYGPGVVVISQPYTPVYATPYLPFYAPTYQTVYNENTYYVGSQNRIEQLEAGGDQAKEALRNAYPANSFQAAFADIARAWTDSDIALLRRHLRDKDTRISVSLNKKYSYSITSGDFSEITRDALDRLQTVSFDFTRLRKAKNGDVTAYGTHVYRVADGTDSSAEAGDDKTVPFDQSGTDSNALPYNQSNDPSSGVEKTVYVSYTLRRHEGEWYVTATDSSDRPLVTDSQ